MPLYDYRCRSCGRTWEQDMPIALRDKAPCPRCGKRDAKIVFRAAPRRVAEGVRGKVLERLLEEISFSAPDLLASQRGYNPSRRWILLNDPKAAATIPATVPSSHRLAFTRATDSGLSENGTIQGVGDLNQDGAAEVVAVESLLLLAGGCTARTNRDVPSTVGNSTAK